MRTFKHYVLLKENAVVNIEDVAKDLQFKPTSKKKLAYRYVNPDQSKPKLTMPPMSYTVVDHDRPIATVTADGLETTNTAQKNDIVMSGPNGEMYVIKSAKFAKLYSGQVGGPVTTEQTPRMVAAYDGPDEVMFKAPWGTDMVLKPGDYLVKEGEGQYYRIAKEEYEQTYNPPGKVG